MSQRKPYPSDLSDARWALIEPTLSAWRKARLDRRPTGQPAQVELRDVFNAILYINRTGIPWKYLPHDFPNHGTVYAYYAAWRDEGILAQLNYDLTSLARVKEGRKPEPTASVIDTQSVKTSTNVPLSSQGTDAAKKIVGRKRGIITDTLGLLLAVTVTAASLSENAVGIHLLDQAKKTYPTISKSWVDTGFNNAFIEHGAKLGIDVEVVNRNPKIRGFHVVKRRWAVEICQAQCAHGVCCPAVSAVLVQMRRLYQPGGRVRRSRSSASSCWSAWAMRRWASGFPGGW